MIKNELMEEIICISKKNKNIDKSLLKRIIIDEINQSDDIVKSNFNSIKFVDIEGSVVYAQTDRYSGVIEYDYEKVINSFPVDAKNYLRINLKMIQYLLHEIQHLNGLSKINENSFESKLLKISSAEYVYNEMYEYLKQKYKSDRKIKKVFCKLYNNFSDEKWEILPSEKFAELESYKELINSLNNYPYFEKKFRKTYAIIFYEYFNRLKMGYSYNEQKEKYDAPLFKYILSIRKLGCKTTLENLGIPKDKYIEILTGLPLEKRMEYGLPITNEEMRIIDDQKKLIKSTI